MNATRRYNLMAVSTNRYFATNTRSECLTSTLIHAISGTASIMQEKLVYSPRLLKPRPQPSENSVITPYLHTPNPAHPPTPHITRLSPNNTSQHAHPSTAIHPNTHAPDRSLHHSRISRIRHTSTSSLATPNVRNGLRAMDPARNATEERTSRAIARAPAPRSITHGQRQLPSVQRTTCVLWLCSRIHRAHAQQTGTETPIAMSSRAGCCCRWESRLHAACGAPCWSVAKVEVSSMAVVRDDRRSGGTMRVRCAGRRRKRGGHVRKKSCRV